MSQPPRLEGYATAGGHNATLLRFLASDGSTVLFTMDDTAATALTGSGAFTITSTVGGSGTLIVWDGTAAHGAVKAITNGVFGSSVSLFGDSTDSFPRVTILSLDTSLNFGPGGSSTVDWKMLRTGVGVATISTGELRITSPGTDTTSVLTGASTSTLTNKRITKRVTSQTGTAPTWNTDTCDVLRVTAINGAINIGTNMTAGSPQIGDTKLVLLTDDGTARAITWGGNFEASGNVALPTTTVVSTRLHVGFIWNSVTTKWTCVAVA